MYMLAFYSSILWGLLISQSYRNLLLVLNCLNLKAILFHKPWCLCIPVLSILSKDEEHVSVHSWLNHSYLAVFLQFCVHTFKPLCPPVQSLQVARRTIVQYLLDCSRLIHVLDSRTHSPHHYFGFVQQRWIPFSCNNDKFGIVGSCHSRINLLHSCQVST